MHVPSSLAHHFLNELFDRQPPASASELRPSPLLPSALLSTPRELHIHNGRLQDHPPGHAPAVGVAPSFPTGLPRRSHHPLDRAERIRLWSEGDDGA